MQNRNRRLNRSLSPFPVEHNSSNLTISPDYSSKSILFIISEVNFKQNSNTNADSHVIPSNTKEFFQSSPISTDYQRNKKKKSMEDQFYGLSLNDINLQLDNNSISLFIKIVNEIIYLLGKRRQLLNVKKRKVRDQVQAKLNEAKSSQVMDLNEFVYARDRDFLKITEFCKSTQTAVSILSKLLQVIPNLNDPNLEQKQKSQMFWQKNRQLQNDIDELLAKLKSTDKNVNLFIKTQLQKENLQVQDICKQLDRIEDHLKSFVGSRTAENLDRVEPLFDAKRKKYDVLNRKIKTLDYCKDTKIDFIKKIKKVLDELLAIRQKRLKQIAQFFGLDNFDDFSQIDFKDQGDFTNSFEQLLRIKEKDSYLEGAERQIMSNIESLQKEQERLYNELLKKQSDQAKAYHSFNDIVMERVKYASILNLFGAQTENNSIFYIDPKDLTRKFKQYKGVIKIFLEEESSLRQGLVKTNETSRTFMNLLSSTQNQKQRRYELLSLLETCIRRRGEYEQKKEELRNLAFEQSRNEQQLNQYEEELQTVLTDGDIENYKQIGQAIGQCEKEKSRLNLFKQKIQKQMQHMDREVISMANKVKQQYEDILCDIVPSDCQYSLKNGQDVKKLRNHLRKMYKRLGILSHESN